MESAGVEKLSEEELNRLGRDKQIEELKKDHEKLYSKITSMENYDNLNIETQADYLVNNLLPSDLLGVVAAPGGTGKTFFLLDLAISVTTGQPFLENPNWTTTQGKVLCVMAEDSENTLHKRSKKILKHRNLEGNEYLGDLDLIPAYGEETYLGYPPSFKESNLKESPFFLFLERLVTINRYDLVILDPLTHFLAGNEDIVNTKIFVILVERLRKTIAKNHGNHTVILYSHHTTKGTTKGKNNSLSEAIRGSGALVNSPRWACMLRNKEDLSDEEQKVQQGDLRLDVVKANDMPKPNFSEIWKLPDKPHENSFLGGCLTCDPGPAKKQGYDPFGLGAHEKKPDPQDLNEQTDYNWDKEDLEINYN